MITIYTSVSSSSSRKALEWLKYYQLPHKELSIVRSYISEEDIIHMLSLTECGTQDLISTNGLTYKKLNKTINFEKISLNNLIHLITVYRGLLKCPIIVDEKHLQVGFNDDDIRQFLPSKIRKLGLEEMRKKRR